MNQEGNIFKNPLIDAVIAIIIIALAGYYYIYIFKPASQPAKNTDTLKKLDTALDVVTASSAVTVTSTNPAKQAIPQINPIEKTNPFKNAYTNPF